MFVSLFLLFVITGLFVGIVLDGTHIGQDDLD